jgi:uncharacterized repeat protein (TIGR01451 family)
VTRRRVERWGVGLAGTLALAGLGLLFATPALLVGAAIPLSYVLYGAVSGVPTADLAARRSFARSDPRPGETVEVTITLENTGQSVLPDVRVIDGVPDELAVTDGSPRACVALRPGESVTTTYTVLAKRGAYEFTGPAVRLRSLAGSEQVTTDSEASGDGTLTCANPVSDPPLREATLPRAGTLPTDTGGTGLEFYATRQYQHGDPMNRVDWRHYAKSGEFVTVQYRQEQAVRTVLVVDARPVGRVTPRPGYPTGAELSAYAAERLYGALERAGVVTSLTAVGVETGLPAGVVGPDGLPWVDTDADSGAGARAETVFGAVRTVADDRAVDAGMGTLGTFDGPGAAGTRAGRAGLDPGTRAGTASPDGGRDELTDRLLARLPPNAQVVVCTPLLDDWPVEFVRELAVRNTLQMVVSPDVTGGETPGQRFAAIHRDLRLRTAERAGATLVSWPLDRPIDAALRRSLPQLLSQS